MNPGFKAFTKGKRFIFYPILSTNTLKKCKKIGLDNWNLDISLCFVFVFLLLFSYSCTKQFWAIESGGFMFDYDCLG